MITLPPSTTPRSAYTIAEAAALFGRGRDWFRERLLDTGIIKKNPFGQIWASECTEEHVRKTMAEMGLDGKITIAMKIKQLPRKEA